jgi:hypothetical protein
MCQSGNLGLFADCLEMAAFVTECDQAAKQGRAIAADMYASLPQGGESPCRTDLGHLHAWADLPTPAHA